MESQDAWPDGWKPIAISEPVLAQLAQERPDIPWLRRWILENYAFQSGICFDVQNAAPAEVLALARWLAFQEVNNGVGSLRRRWPQLESVLHGDFSMKINVVSQRRCFVCDRGRSLDDLLPISRYVIRITPISRQAAKPTMFRAFQAAFAQRFSRQPVSIGNTGRLCVALTFVLDKGRRDRDLDNMSKAALDAFSRVAGFDDGIIDHLDVMKLVFRDTEEYMYIRIAPSALNEHEDVVAPTFHQTWLGMQAINLSDYMVESE